MLTTVVRVVVLVVVVGKGVWRENWQTAKIRAKEWYTTKDGNSRMDRLGVETKTRRRAVGRKRVELRVERLK